MKLLGSTKDTIDVDKNSENVPKLENVEVVLVHCNLVNNACQQHSIVLFTFVPNKQYGQLIIISPHSLVFLKTMNTDFSEIELWFMDQNNNVFKKELNASTYPIYSFLFRRFECTTLIIMVNWIKLNWICRSI